VGTITAIISGAIAEHLGGMAIGGTLASRCWALSQGAGRWSRRTRQLARVPRFEDRSRTRKRLTMRPADTSKTVHWQTFGGAIENPVKCVRTTQVREQY